MPFSIGCLCFFMATWLLANIALSSGVGPDDATPMWDESGYIMSCPCYGNIGNQAILLLGALRFAKKLNRTLVIPAWNARDRLLPNTPYPPYDRWFDIEPLAQFHRVISMETFMAMHAPEHWKEDGEARRIYCGPSMASDLQTCVGNIGRKYWEYFGISFSGGMITLPASLNVMSSKHAWDVAYPADEYPVLALTNTPGYFPIAEKDRELQKYIKWSRVIETMATEFIKNSLSRPYIGIHLRNGKEWPPLCENVRNRTIKNSVLWGSQECVGYGRIPARRLTYEMCWTTAEDAKQKVLKLARTYGVEQLYIATDNDPMLEVFSNTHLKVMQYHTNYPIMDLAVLSKADVFIGNCVSTFTSFVARQREVEGKQNFFFGLDETEQKGLVRDDL